jgi:hypothetical protein
MQTNPESKNEILIAFSPTTPTKSSRNVNNKIKN